MLSASLLLWWLRPVVAGGLVGKVVGAGVKGLGQRMQDLATEYAE